VPTTSLTFLGWNCSTSNNVVSICLQLYWTQWTLTLIHSRSDIYRDQICFSCHGLVSITTCNSWHSAVSIIFGKFISIPQSWL
jgi:hypothetical protein